MTNPIALDVADKLIEEGEFTTEQLIIGSAPKDQEGLFITLTEDGGSSNPKWLRDYNSLVINVHGAGGDYLNAWQNAQKIKDALLGRKPFIVGNVEYVRFVINNDIKFLGYDENNRPIFSMVFEITRDYSDTDVHRSPIT